MVRGVIFDLGGTLITQGDYEQANATALLAWLRGRGYTVDDRLIADLVAERRARFQERAGGVREIPAEAALHPILQRYHLPVDSTFLADAERAFFAAELEGARPLKGATEVLPRLHHLGLRLALASNASSHYFVEECCRRLGFAAYLDPIVSSAAVGWGKPDSRIFQTILVRWSLPRATVVMVGDTLEADIAGAHQMGIRAVLLTAEHGPENEPAAELVRPDAVATDLAHVARIIEGWISQ